MSAYTDGYGALREEPIPYGQISSVRGVGLVVASFAVKDSSWCKIYRDIHSAFEIATWLFSSKC